MKLASYKCPNCGANVRANPSLDIYMCNSCGSTFKEDADWSQFEYKVYRKIDEAKLKEAETRRYIQERELRHKERTFRWEILLKVLGGMAIILLIAAPLIGYGIYEHVASTRIEAKKAQGMICAGYSGDYEDKKYEVVVEELELLGFSDIKTVNLNDAGINIFKKGKVASVSIDGKKYFGSSDYFFPSSKVIVSYH